MNTTTKNNNNTSLLVNSESAHYTLDQITLNSNHSTTGMNHSYFTTISFCQRKEQKKYPKKRTQTLEKEVQESFHNHKVERSYQKGSTQNPRIHINIKLYSQHQHKVCCQDTDNATVLI